MFSFILPFYYLWSKKQLESISVKQDLKLNFSNFFYLPQIKTLFLFHIVKEVKVYQSRILYSLVIKKKKFFIINDCFLCLFFVNLGVYGNCCVKVIVQGNITIPTRPKKEPPLLSEREIYTPSGLRTLINLFFAMLLTRKKSRFRCLTSVVKFP